MESVIKKLQHGQQKRWVPSTKSKKGGGISYSWWRVFPSKPMIDEPQDVYDLKYLTKLMKTSMAKKKEDRLAYFLPRAKLGPRYDIDHTLAPGIVLIGALVAIAFTIDALATLGSFTGLMLTGASLTVTIPLFLFGAAGTLMNISNDINSAGEHNQRRRLLYDNRYDIANFLFQMNKQKGTNEYNNFILVGYYGILMRILMGIEPGNTDDLRDAVIQDIVTSELHTRNHTNDWAYRDPVVSTTSDEQHNKKMKYNKAFFERLIYFNIPAYNMYIDYFHNDSYMRDDAKYAKNIAEFYILASTYQTCVLHLMRMNASIQGHQAKGLSAVLSKYNFDKDVLKTADTIEKMLGIIKKYDPLTSSSMKTIYKYIEDGNSFEVHIPEHGGGGAVKKRRKPNPYNIFVGKQITAGKTMAQAAALWKQTRG